MKISMHTFIILGLSLLAALVAHIAVLNAIPRWETDKVIGNIADITAASDNPLLVNKLRHSGLRLAGRGDLVVRDNPDTITSLATYDLKDGPLRFSGVIPEDSVYWSISLFAHNTDTFFILNDSDAASSRPRIVVQLKDQNYEARSGEQVVVSPSRKGVLIVRLIVPDRNDEATIAKFGDVLSQANFGPAS